MSEEKKTETKVEERTPYEINIDPETFDPDSEAKYLTSTEFCGLINVIFRAAFRDYYGSKFELSNNGVPSISLHFSHIEAGEGEAVATVRSGAKTIGNSVIDKTRQRDHMMTEGDRYMVSEDGKDVISKLLFPYIYNKGKINWKNITAEVSDGGNQMFYGQGQQLTKITGIDPKRICAMLWGTKDDEGEVDYGISVLKDLSVNPMIMPGTVPSNYVLMITKAHTSKIRKTYEKLGIGIVGSNIIR